MTRSNPTELPEMDDVAGKAIIANARGGLEGLAEDAWSIAMVDDGVDHYSGLPRWCLTYWEGLYDTEHAKKTWRKALDFVQGEQQKYADRGDAEREAIVRGVGKRINKLQWNSTLFMGSASFGITAVILADVLEVESLASHPQLHCALVNLKAKYQDRLNKVAIVDSQFDHGTTVVVRGCDLWAGRAKSNIQSSCRMDASRAGPDPRRGTTGER